MRVTFYAPKDPITDQSLMTVLQLVDEHPSPDAIQKLTAMERIVVYDWAIREHLRASDNIVRRRERPSVLVRQANDESY